MNDLLLGIRVLDLTNVLAGPYCGYQLALLGADVVKIEAPDGGDLARQLGGSVTLSAAGMGSSFLAQNAGKRSVVIDLKTDEGRRQLFDLVANAEVLVENFRPGVMDRLGVGYEALKAANPGLIYCAISGFGQSGPMRDNPAYDQIIQGLSGVMSVTGTDETAPLRVGYPVCDTLGGLFGAFGITSALLRKVATGQGAFLDVSLLECTLSALGWPVSNYLCAGIEPRALGNENATAAPSGTFTTGDGLLNIAANKQEQFEMLCCIIGREDLIEDPRFAERETRKENRSALNQEIEAGLKSRSAESWEVALNSVGVPAGRVLTIPQILAEPQIKERSMTHTFEMVESIGRPLTVLRGGFLVDGEAPKPRRPPPVLGDAMSEVLGTLVNRSASQ